MLPILKSASAYYAVLFLMLALYACVAYAGHAQAAPFCAVEVVE